MIKKFLVAIILFPVANLSYATPKNCIVKVADDMGLMSNQCFEFDPNLDNNRYQAAKGYCKPEWDGMKVTTKMVNTCPKATHGSCVLTFPMPSMKFEYTVHYYAVPNVTAENNKTNCLAGKGRWIFN